MSLLRLEFQNKDSHKEPSNCLLRLKFQHRKPCNCPLLCLKFQHRKPCKCPLLLNFQNKESHKEPRENLISSSARWHVFFRSSPMTTTIIQMPPKSYLHNRSCVKLLNAATTKCEFRQNTAVVLPCGTSRRGFSKRRTARVISSPRRARSLLRTLLRHPVRETLLKRNSQQQRKKSSSSSEIMPVCASAWKW